MVGLNNLHDDEDEEDDDENEECEDGSRTRHSSLRVKENESEESVQLMNELARRVANMDDILDDVCNYESDDSGIYDCLQ